MTEPLDLNDLRTRILAGQPYTSDELKTALALLRVARADSAGKTVERRKAKAAASAPMSDAELDASLAGLGLTL